MVLGRAHQSCYRLKTSVRYNIRAINSSERRMSACKVKRTSSSWPAIPRETCCAIPSNRGDDPCALEYLPNPIVTLIGHKQIARFIKRVTGRNTELGTGCCAAIPRKTGDPTACIRRDYSSPRINRPDSQMDDRADLA